MTTPTAPRAGEITEEQVREVAGNLRDYATHFERRDWDYTRDMGDLRYVTYAEPSPWARLRWACRIFRRSHNPWHTKGIGFHLRVSWHILRQHQVRPDGVLDSGGVIVHWEETGEYLQFVQPSVGELIAEWLSTEPGNPHARRVAAEMRRIQDKYAARCAQDERESR